MKISLLKTLTVMLMLMLSRIAYAQPPVPNTTFTYSFGCVTGTVTRTSNPPEDYDWFWQTSSTGTATDKGSGPTFTSTTTTNVYLRARTKTTPYQWSSSSKSAGKLLVIQPDGPSSSTGAARLGLGTVTLSVSEVQDATGYRWYTEATGGIPVVEGSFEQTFTVSQTTTYYVSAIINGCESKRRSVTATVEPGPVIYAIGKAC